VSTHPLAALWSREQAPPRDGLYRTDAPARDVFVDGADLTGFELGEVLDLDAMLRDEGEYAMRADPSAELVLPDGSGVLCCGEGALGAEGFFALLTPERELDWIVVLHESNPFHHVALSGSLATFTNNLGNALTVDLASPEFRPSGPR
jgi:hypothetical protein